MANKAKFQAIKGTRDLLPPETQLWNRVEQTAHEVFATFGFGEIRLPIFEQSELCARSIGAETDVVSKEMYSWVEGWADASFAIFREWSIKRDPESRQVLRLMSPIRASKPPEKRDVGPLSQNTYMTLDGIETIARFRYRVSLMDVFELQDAGMACQQQGRAMPQLLLVTVPGTIPDGMESFAAKANVRLEKINIDDFEPPQLLALRPEATASVCRAYIEHSMQQLLQPVKLYYMGPMFRRERPQKGRYRQFYQIGAEILGGSDAPAIDAELIEMLMTFFGKLELEGTTLHINSIGHSAPNCRRGYVEKLKAELEKVKDKLGPDSQRRIDTNPLRVLDSKLEFEQGVIEKLPRIADHLCEDCAKHYAAVKQHLELRGVIYRENWRLVRGLDYYMRTTFEITAQGLGSQNAVCGGGRYDGLVELLGGPPTKGIGFAIGEDRLILSLQEGGKAPAKQGRDVYIAWMGERAYATAVRAAKDLRNAGFSVELPPVELKFGKALGQADKLGARFALILGDNEVSEGLWTLKTLADGTQTKLPEPAIIEHLRKSLSSPVVADL
jgi:histidyl-tRNA synthetase